MMRTNLAVLAATLALPVQAAVIDEADIGDFSNGSGAIGALDLGTTSVFGEISGECEAPRRGISCDFIGDHWDTIGFTIAAGTELVGFSFTIGDLSVTNDSTRPGSATPFARFTRSNPALLSGFPFPTPLVDRDGSYGGLDGTLGSGDYTIGFSTALGSGPNVGDSVFFTYSVELTTQEVAPVPLPASGLLLAAGLGAFALRRRGAS